MRPIRRCRTFIVHGRQGSDFWMSGDFWTPFMVSSCPIPLVRRGSSARSSGVLSCALGVTVEAIRSLPGIWARLLRLLQSVDDVARSAPAEFVENVLPFVIDVAMADQYHTDGELPGCPAWMLRGVPQTTLWTTPCSPL